MGWPHSTWKTPKLRRNNPLFDTYTQRSGTFWAFVIAPGCRNGPCCHWDNKTVVVLRSRQFPSNLCTPLFLFQCKSGRWERTQFTYACFALAMSFGLEIFWFVLPSEPDVITFGFGLGWSSQPWQSMFRSFLIVDLTIYTYHDGIWVDWTLECLYTVTFGSWWSTADVKAFWSSWHSTHRTATLSGCILLVIFLRKIVNEYLKHNT